MDNKCHCYDEIDQVFHKFICLAALNFEIGNFCFDFEFLTAMAR